MLQKIITIAGLVSQSSMVYFGNTCFNYLALVEVVSKLWSASYSWKVNLEVGVSIWLCGFGDRGLLFAIVIYMWPFFLHDTPITWDLPTSWAFWILLSIARPYNVSFDYTHFILAYKTQYHMQFCWFWCLVDETIPSGPFFFLRLIFYFHPLLQLWKWAAH